MEMIQFHLLRGKMDIEKHMCRLYEKFILEYYSCHYPESQISWSVDDGIRTMLPIM